MMSTNDLAYVGTRKALTWLYRFWFRIEVREAHHVPASGGVLLAPNHRSFLDPPAIAIAAPRPSWFMAKKWLFQRGWFAAILRRLHAYPVDVSGADRVAISDTIALLRDGKMVTVFPEGGIVRGDEIAELRSGVAFMALKAGVPVVPVYIAGAEAAMGLGSRWPRPRKVVVTFGEPLPLDAYQEMNRRQAITALMVDLRSALEDLARRARELA